MDVNVDIRDTTGRTLADAPRAKAVASTEVFRDLDRDADLRVHQIIANNSMQGTGEARRVASRPASAAYAS